MSRHLRRRARPARGSVLVAAAVSLALLAPTSASADPGKVVARPIANADSYAIYASGEYTLDVLENDRTSAFSGGGLTLCGVSVDAASQQVLYAEIDRADPTRVFVETKLTASGAATFTYDACQGNRVATTTVTLEITQLKAPKVRKLKNRRAKITAKNPNAVQLQILWGSNRANANDGRRGIRAGRKVTIKVKRTRIYWVAFRRDQGTIVVAGEGTVRKIKRKR